MGFRIGQIYLLFCLYTKPPKPKIAICVCDSKPLFFFINSEPRPYLDQSSQILVTPHELPFLDYNSYINTSEVVTCVEPITCIIKKKFSVVPKSVADKIKKTVKSSTTLAERHIKTILRNL